MILAGGIALVTSGFIALVLVLTRDWHGHLTLDSHDGVQKLHVAPTPRIGGLAVVGGLVAGGLALPAATQSLWWLICLAALPAFLSGLAEDVTKRVGVRSRLLATIFSGVLLCLLTGQAISRADLPLLDTVVAYWPAAVVLTAFAIGGIANALNIIDGVHGLASGTAIIIMAGFALIAFRIGDVAMLGICLVSIGATCGFFLLNFPGGRIFFGDAGAYTAGFLLAAVGVLLPARNPELSPSVGLLALSYPVIETMVSIHRRTVRSGIHPGQPDRLHLHSLVYRSLSRRLAQGMGRPEWRNPATALVVWVLPLLSILLAVLAAHSTFLVWVGIGVVLLVYILIYRRVALLRRGGGPLPRIG